MVFIQYIGVYLCVVFQEADFIAFMKDPSNPNPGKPPTPSPEAHWSDAEGHENVKHLTAENFESALAEHKSVLVMFYAPCKFTLIY